MQNLTQNTSVEIYQTLSPPFRFIRERPEHGNVKIDGRSHIIFCTCADCVALVTVCARLFSPPVGYYIISTIISDDQLAEVDRALYVPKSPKQANNGSKTNTNN